MKSEQNQNINYHENEYEVLCKVLNPKCPLSSSVFVYGTPKCGKSYLVRQVMTDLKDSNPNIKVVFINGLEIVAIDKSAINIYGEILFELTKDYAKCAISDVDTFEWELNGLCKKSGWSQVYVVVDNVQRFSELNSRVLRVLVRFNEALRNDTTLFTVLISQTPAHKLFTDIVDSQMYLQFVERFSNQQMVQIIQSGQTKHCNSPYKQRIFCEFAQQMVEALVRFCNDLSELRFAVHTQWQNVKQLLQSNTEYSPAELSNMFRDSISQALGSLYNPAIVSSSGQAPHSIDLPLWPCYLLVAAFIASYNSPHSDIKVFVAKTDRMSKRQKHMETKLEKTTNLLNGPKWFSLDRLSAIFLALCRDQSNLNLCVALPAILGPLLHMGLIQPASNPAIDPFRPRKYRCTAPIELVLPAARSINIELTTLLTDF